MEDEEEPLFLGVPGVLVDVGVQVVVPPLAALLTNTLSQYPCDEGPFLRTVFFDQQGQLSVFIRSPHLFFQNWLLSVDSPEILSLDLANKFFFDHYKIGNLNFGN